MYKLCTKNAFMLSFFKSETEQKKSRNNIYTHNMTTYRKIVCCLLTLKNEKILDVAELMAVWTLKRLVVNPVKICKQKIKSA